MSGILNFVARFGDEVVVEQVSSGVLAELYDPRIFGDEGSSLRQFISDNSYGETDSPPRLSPWYLGLVVFDFDAKQVFDCQLARDIDRLSSSFDWSWKNLGALFERGWLGEGLVGPTGAIVAKFPEHLSFDWYDEQQRAHLESLGPPVFDENGSPLLTDARLALYASAPRFAIRPPGWQFHSFAAADCERLRDKLSAVGFPVDADDRWVWQAWREEHAGAASCDG